MMTTESFSDSPLGVPAVSGEDDAFAQFYPPGVPRSMVYDPRSVLELVAETVRRAPHRAAYVFRGATVTFSELEALSERFARGLGSLGVTAGDRVLLCLPNIPQSPIAILAVWRLGATCVMSNPLNTVRELAFQLSDSNAKVAVTLDLLLERVLEASASLQPAVAVVATHLSDFMKTSERLLLPLFKPSMYRRTPRRAGVSTFRSLLSQNATNRSESARPGCFPSPEDLAVLLYTGGSTGIPKGVAVRHRHLSVNAQQIISWLACFDTDQEVVLGLFPFFTGAGLTALMCGSLLRGATVVLVPRPVPAEIPALIQRHAVTVLPAVPTLYAGMLALPKFDAMARDMARSLRACLSGAAPLSEETKRNWESKTGTCIVELYGLSETTAMAHGNPYHRTKLRSVGLPISDTLCRIISDDGIPLPQGQVGEICLAGPQVADSYYNQPQATEAAFRNGWLHTGDLGYLDEDGYLFIVDRKKEMIITSGYNVYPREVDEVLMMHPSVLEVATVGVAHDYRGQCLKAHVVSKPGVPFDAAALEAHCRQHLAAYKIPRFWHASDSLPKNAMGKVLKSAL
jgi:long-chain acyl-CoA synthetase